jgi:hypothetical protein
MDSDAGGWLWLVIDVLMVAVLTVAVIYATVLWRRRRGRLEQVSGVPPRSSMSAKPNENENPKPIARAHERHHGARARRSDGTVRAACTKKSSRADNPAPKMLTQRYAYASKYLGDRDDGGFAPACSSQDLDRVGRRRCSPIGLAGGTLSHPG